jgi:hypothetical protein
VVCRFRDECGAGPFFARIGCGQSVFIIIISLQIKFSTMSKHLQIVTGKQPGQTLSKEQKRFNSLVKKIKTLRAQIEKTKELDLELRRLGEERVTPAEKAAMAADRDWIMALNNSLFRAKLGKKQAEKLELILLEEIGHLLETSFLPGRYRIAGTIRPV